ncbi:MAG: Glu-tRNA(Gln) amidotransferase subunit GatE, partial [Candidatus Bilamarchaeaceae archaeon]
MEEAQKPRLKCGIEIHQRLDTNKLFCRCPSILSEGEKPDAQILRKLRAGESEMGELDRAARLEQERQLDFRYDVFRKNCCAVETDEEPPLPMDREALNLVLGICQQLHMRIVDQIHIMRKIVVDGSNTSGFQRTALVATNGYIETSKGKVGIDTVAIEEESAGILENQADGAKNYRLDRLGIPLIEIATSPDIIDGEHCKETAEKIGMVLRATGKAARGLGTIRQDINISIPGGARVEVKGVQDLKMIPRIVDLEVERQGRLLGILKKLKESGGRWEEPRVQDLTRLFAQTECGMINRGILAGKRVLGIKLRGHRGMLGMEIQPGKRYGTELSDYAKTAGLRGIIHSDEDLSRYRISAEEASAVMDSLSGKEHDAFILVVAEEGMGRMALARVIERASMREIPGQTRRAEPDGTTSYMRPLPGRARMYPETDIHPIGINAEMLREALAGAGEGLEAKSERLRK